jgi:membrane protein DedA with SNARE-associated domain
MKIGICFVGVASNFLLILALVTTQRIGQSDAFAPPQSAVPLSRQQSLHWQTTQSRRQYQKHQSTPYQQKQPTPLVLHGVAPGILTSTFETISAFSKSSLSSAASGGGSSIVAGAAGSQAQLLQSMTQRALATPPVAYFLALMAAGCGVPVSEDALCVFAGAVLWPFQSQDQRRKLFMALYLGVVGSDFVTFWIGRAMRSGILAPLAKKFNLQSSTTGISTTSNDNTVMQQQNDHDNNETTTSSPSSQTSTKKAPKTTVQQRFLQRAGRWAGFVIRFSVGTRGPLMLMTGFSNQVPFIPFALGASVGAMVTVPLQLYVGYALSMRGSPSGVTVTNHNPSEASAAAALAVVAGISTFVLGAAIVLTTATVGSLVMSKIWSKRNQRRQQRLLLSKATNNTIDIAL